MIGETLGNYTVVEKLGAGGMGVVYAAEHKLIGRKAAIKLLLPELSRNKDLVDRFFNEARAATVIRHAGIVDVFDFGFTEDGSAYIAMEYLEGETLSARIAAGRIEQEDVVRIARQVANALEAAHSAGIVHRDLKPDNVFLVPDSEVPGGERIKILDFGIAKLANNQAPGTSKTQTGQMMGSPLYMAPEQCKGAGEVDARADIYSLGCVMYEMLCRRPVFDGTGVGEVIAKQVYEAPEPPSRYRQDLSEPLEAVILRTLAKQPDERFASMSEVVRALDQASGGRHVTSRGGASVWTEDAIAATVAPSEPPQPTSVGQTAGTAPPAPRPTQTTLGSAAAEVSAMPEPETRGGPAKWIAAMLGVALVSGGGAYMVLRDSGESGSAPTVASEAPAEVEPVAVEPPDAAPAGSEKVTISVDSVPGGAEVYRVSDGVRIGRTPFSEEYQRSDGTLVVRLKADGYQDHPLEIRLDQSRQIEASLERVQRSGSHRSGKHRVEKKPVETKPVEKKPVEKKPVETKPVETKPVETKPVEKKPVETKPPEEKEWGKTYNPLDDGS